MCCNWLIVDFDAYSFTFFFLVPNQKNGYDCGVCVCKYSFEVVKKATEMEVVSFQNLREAVASIHHDETYIYSLRNGIRSLLLELRQIYDNSIDPVARQAHLRKESATEKKEERVVPKKKEKATEATTRKEKAKEPRIGFRHLGLLVFGGKIDKEVSSSPVLTNAFQKAWNPDNILKGWKRVGAVPLTRNCVNHPLVRHQITTTNGEVDTSLDPKAEEYAKIEGELDTLISILNRDGLNGNVFEAKISRARREALEKSLSANNIICTAPISPERAKYIASSGNAGQNFRLMGGSGMMSADIAFMGKENL